MDDKFSLGRGAGREPAVRWCGLVGGEGGGGEMGDREVNERKKEFPVFGFPFCCSREFHFPRLILQFDEFPSHSSLLLMSLLCRPGLRRSLLHLISPPLSAASLPSQTSRSLRVAPFLPVGNRDLKVRPVRRTSEIGIFGGSGPGVNRRERKENSHKGKSY